MVGVKRGIKLQLEALCPSQRAPVSPRLGLEP